MYCKRNELFRFTFREPLQATIKAFQNKEQTLIFHGIWEAFIVNISPNGMKIISSANIDPSKDLQIRTSFTLNNTIMEINGSISWKKTSGQNFEYGILENNSAEMRHLLISELTTYLGLTPNRIGI